MLRLNKEGVLEEEYSDFLDDSVIDEIPIEKKLNDIENRIAEFEDALIEVAALLPD